MCGVAGSIGRRPLSEFEIKRCLESMRHRGPDDSGCTQFETSSGLYASMLFRRLSVIDLDRRSNQPMEADGVRLAMNGEIYNYKEVRKKLSQRGRTFRTASDTEVLLQGYLEYGWSILDQLEGMWSLALYDKRLEVLSLSRDRFGEKPLYMTRDDQNVLYASEVAQLQDICDRRLEPNVEQLQQFMTLGYKSLYKTSETFFRGVSEVPAGSIVHVKDIDSIECEKYWRPALGPETDINFEEAVDETRRRVILSLDLRLRADVPVAFSLSGGVDSVSLASVATRELGKQVDGFTIVHSDPRYEETAIVNAVALELGVSHTKMELQKSGFLELLKQMIQQHAAPVYTLTSFVQRGLMQEIARQGFKVVIGGSGADEIFSGYYDHHLFYIASMSDETKKEAVQSWQDSTARHVRNPYLKNPDLFVQNPEFRGHIYLNASTYASYMVKPGPTDFVEERYSESPLRNRMLKEIFHESVPVLMKEEDLNAMAFSLENRSPYLDRHLFEFATTIPTRLLVQNGVAKAVLREAMRGIAPDVVLDNPKKVGFNAPIEDLLDLNSGPLSRELLSDSPIFDVVRRESVAELLSRSQLSNSESKFLFSFLSSKYFLECYL